MKWDATTLECRFVSKTTMPWGTEVNICKRSTEHTWNLLSIAGISPACSSPFTGRGTMRSMVEGQRRGSMDGRDAPRSILNRRRSPTDLAPRGHLPASREDEGMNGSDGL